MALDGLMLHSIKEELSALCPARIDKVNMPSKDMLILTVYGALGAQKILLSANASSARIHLTTQKYENPKEASSTCMLFRKFLQGGRIITIAQHECDRILKLTIECTTDLGDVVLRYLIIEIMGKHSNIMLCNHDNTIIESVHRVSSSMSRVRVVYPGVTYALPPSQNKLNPFVASESEFESALSQSQLSLVQFLQKHMSGLSKTSAEIIAHKLSKELFEPLNSNTLQAIAQDLHHFYHHLSIAPTMLVDEFQTPVDIFCLNSNLYSPSRLVSYPSFAHMLDVFYTNRDVGDQIKQKGQNLIRAVENALSRVEHRLDIIHTHKEDRSKAEQFKRYGELIQAHMYALNVEEKGHSSLTLANYYSETMENVIIPLRSDLSIKDNANAFFKKYHKAKVASELAKEQEVQAKEEQSFLKQCLLEIELSKSTEELDDIKLILASRGYIKGEKKLRKTIGKSKEIRIEKDGVIILVGKNSLQNDRITQSAKPDEFWFHVQGVPGSHVVVKSTNPSEDMLFFAAQLAAFFSTAKDQTTIVVDYTQKKHIKKPASSPAGFVYYKNFKSITLKLTEQDKANLAQFSSALTS